MMKTTTHEIMFKSNRKGVKCAYYFSRPCFRWMRMGVAQAELELATGNATLADDKRFPTTGEKAAQATGEAIYNEIMKGNK